MNKNNPEIWRTFLPWPPAADGHKYDRGHVIVAGGRMTGAARLAAQAAMRVGAGLCTIAGPSQFMGVYLDNAPHLLFEAVENIRDFPLHLSDPRRNAAIIGPGMGQEDGLREAVLNMLRLKKPTVLDADALTVFAGYRDLFSSAVHSRCVLTPHEGEFSKIFPDLTGDKTARAIKAAETSGCVVLLKGAETIIATPGHEPVINTHSSPWLATAGAGDVLAGMIGGLMAQGMEPFQAACAASWMHGEAGIRLNAGLVASDLIRVLPLIIKDFS